MVRRALVLVVFALLVAGARADVAPWPFKVPRPEPKPQPAPQPPPPPIDPATGKELFDTREKPKRTGPFRSCGSGAGVGLAGIGAAWAALWLGMRFARAKK
ncbi:MAG: hypothetical protein FJ304_14555 [Planctomycetes bacterium]|nr:hypothetical protein [Planctomycetota bacterium]